ncbi:MAG TPA: DUF3592 domain-containing protein [Cyclobacteriaceae bacterium]|nr:DUF3592 domain-containing protein [Cyclobacteriaceae bacterium]
MEAGNKIILILGILAIAAGIFVIFEASSFQKKATQTEGKVVHVLGSSYKIQYFTNDRTEKICQGSGKTHGFREGNSVKVWYRTDNPDRARLTDGRKGAKTLFIAGIACVLLGVYPLFMKKRDNSSS